MKNSFVNYLIALIPAVALTLLLPITTHPGDALVVTSAVLVGLVVFFTLEWIKDTRSKS